LGTYLFESIIAFDDRGSLYDGDGDLDDWMSPQVRTEYSTRADCIINQYSGFVEPQTGLHPNGNVTMAENMVDNSEYNKC
jgi:putative endopeptidase